MTPKRWQQIKKALHAAMEMEPGRRAAYLDSAYSDDPSLRQEVESLLAANDRARASFLENPPLASDVKKMALNPGSGATCTSSARAHAPWWMYVLAASFFGLFCFSIYTDVVAPEPDGILDADYRGKMAINKVAADSPLARAGIADGDSILAVDGDPMRTEQDWIRQRSLIRSDQPFAREVERQGKRFHVAAMLKRGMWVFGQETVRKVSYFGWKGMMFSFLVISLFVFVRPHDPSARLASVILADWVAIGPLSVPGFSSAGWTGAWRSLPLPVAAFLAIPALCLALYPVLVFAFGTVFPRAYFSSRRSLMAWCAPGLLLVPVLFLNFWPWYQPVPKLTVWLAFVALACVYGIAAIVVVIANYRRLQDQNERRRVRALIPTLITACAIAAQALVALNWDNWFGTTRPAFFSVKALAVDAVLIQLVPLSMAYAILKHRVFEFSFIVRRGIQYALARGVVVWMLPLAGALLLLDVALHRNQTVGAIFSQRGWFYAAIGVLAVVARQKRQSWLEALDRRFFRERYNAQQILRATVEQVRTSGALEIAAPQAVARVEAALHPEFTSLMVREPGTSMYLTMAASPNGTAPITLDADSKLMAVFRALGKPLGISLTESGWLKQQLPSSETDFLRSSRIDLLVPVVLGAEEREALMALGPKRSEEPYSNEDQELLSTIASALALLLERSTAKTAHPGGMEECPQCGRCFESGAGTCTEDKARLTPLPLPRLLVGRYQLQRRLGRGGMGTVYHATDRSLSRQVAVKLVREDRVPSTEAAGRFEREAKTAASLLHPNMAAIFDYGVDVSGRAFLVMELLEGCSLREKLQAEKRIQPGQALALFEGICAALGMAHGRNLVHRDLKPENIFLVSNGEREMAKLLDFGIAKSLPTDGRTLDHGEDDQRLEETAVATTAPGLLVGTLGYMSPEQLHGEPVSLRWDLWALSVVTYETLTGRHPFMRKTTGESQEATLLCQYTPVKTSLPEAPLHWESFFSRTFHQDRSQRPGSVSEWCKALETVLTEPKVHST